MNRIFNERLEIIRGEDKTPILKLRSEESKDPLDLTGVTNITVKFEKSNRQTLFLDMLTKPAKIASIDIGEVVIVADTAGAIGNAILLSFNGTDSIASVVALWNSNNPSNTVTVVGDDSVVPSAGDYRLYGGLNAYEPVVVEGDPVLGKIKVILTDVDTQSLKRGDSQSFSVIVDYGHPPSGLRKKALFRNKLDVIES